jgi:hypothetical protein
MFIGCGFVQDHTQALNWNRKKLLQINHLLKETSIIKLNIIKLLLLKYLPELGLKAIERKVSGWAQEEIRVL